MTEEPRPEPEYGQYATPQEQAKALAKSLPTPEIATPPAAAPTHQGSGRQASGPQGSRPQRSGHQGSARDKAHPAAQLSQQQNPPAPGPRADRLITMMLLAVGLGYALSQIPGNLSLKQVFDQLYLQMGIGSYEVTPTTAVIGVAAIVAQLGIWLLTAIWAFRRLRAGRASWWIPLLGAVVSVAASATLLAVLLWADPAFTTFLSAKGA